jgi:hypothetical protein
VIVETRTNVPCLSLLQQYVVHMHTLSVKVLSQSMDGECGNVEVDRNISRCKTDVVYMY